MFNFWDSVVTRQHSPTSNTTGQCGLSTHDKLLFKSIFQTYLLTKFTSMTFTLSHDRVICIPWTCDINMIDRVIVRKLKGLALLNPMRDGYAILIGSVSHRESVLYRSTTVYRDPVIKVRHNGKVILSGVFVCEHHHVGRCLFTRG